MSGGAARVGPEPGAVEAASGAIVSARVFFAVAAGAIALAELLIAFVDPLAGVALDGLVILALAGHRYVFAPSGRQTPAPALTLASVSLALLPILRLLSLTLPTKRLPEITWYEMIGAPLLVVLIILCRMDAELGAIARARGRTVQQGAVALSGIPLGLIAYLIAKPEPLATGSDGMNYVLGPLILLVFSGLTEELLFRGALTVSLGRIMGPGTALAISTILFAVFHVDLDQPGLVAFAAAYGLAFGLVVRSSGTLWGVAAAHGLLNIGLILVWPSLL